MVKNQKYPDTVVVSTEEEGNTNISVGGKYWGEESLQNEMMGYIAILWLL
jgi:hypothetical protein